MKKIFVLYTGGTIGMIASEHGLRPDTSLAKSALIPFQKQCLFTWHICDPLIDSSAITPQNWLEWFNIIQEALPHHDGVLILHGTDTLAYTANFFALTLNTNKPIILTGAQKPFNTPNSDAQYNLQTAINAFTQNSIQEVLLAFNGKLFPAIGTNKCSTEHNDGFTNPHFGVWSGNTKPTLNQHHHQFNPHTKVAALILTPGISSQMIADTLNHDQLDAAILLSYGHGNAPNDDNLIKAIQHFTQKGKILLNISQVSQGCASAVYAQGSALRDAGVINGGKCNLETAIPLLMLATSNHWQPNQLKNKLMQLQLL